MPYVPDPDRPLINKALEALGDELAPKITNNLSLRQVYKASFVAVSFCLSRLLKGEKYEQELLERNLEANLARAIYEAGEKHGYEGAYLGEFNYAFTMLIQYVPAIKVKSGDWKEEFRYWLYGATCAALVQASHATEYLDICVDGIFEDIKDEYKWEMNRPYEIIGAILKNGHCYFGPFYQRPVEVIDAETHENIGYFEISLKRSEKTLHKNFLDYQLLLVKKPEEPKP